MDILTPGDPKKAKTVRSKEKIFLCHLCGCHWKANRDEYMRDYDFREGNYILRSVCPCCNEVIRVTEST